MRNDLADAAGNKKPTAFLKGMERWCKTAKPEGATGIEIVPELLLQRLIWKQQALSGPVSGR